MAHPILLRTTGHQGQRLSPGRQRLRLYQQALATAKRKLDTIRQEMKRQRPDALVGKLLDKLLARQEAVLMGPVFEDALSPLAGDFHHSQRGKLITMSVGRRHAEGMSLVQVLSQALGLTKRCPCCKRMLEAYHYGIDASKPSGLHPRCKGCQRQRHREIRRDRLGRQSLPMDKQPAKTSSPVGGQVLYLLQDAAPKGKTRKEVIAYVGSRASLATLETALVKLLRDGMARCCRVVSDTGIDEMWYACSTGAEVG